MISCAASRLHRHTLSLGEYHESSRRSTLANKPLGERLLLSSAPFNLELLQYVHWLSTVADGLPSIEMLALTAGLSLSHGASLLLLQVWFFTIGGGTEGGNAAFAQALLVLTLALTALALARLGLMRSFFLWQRPLRIAQVSGRRHDSNAPTTQQTGTTEQHLPSDAEAKTRNQTALMRARRSVATPACAGQKSSNDCSASSDMSLQNARSALGSGGRAQLKRLPDAALRANDTPFSTALADAAHRRALERQQRAANRISAIPSPSVAQCSQDSVAGNAPVSKPEIRTREAVRLPRKEQGGECTTERLESHCQTNRISSTPSSSQHEYHEASSSSHSGCSETRFASHMMKRSTRVSRARAVNEQTRERVAEKSSVGKEVAAKKQQWRPNESAFASGASATSCQHLDADLSASTSSMVNRLKYARAINRVRRSRSVLNDNARGAPSVTYRS